MSYLPNEGWRMWQADAPGRGRGSGPPLGDDLSAQRQALGTDRDVAVGLPLGGGGRGRGQAGALRAGLAAEAAALSLLKLRNRPDEPWPGRPPLAGAAHLT